MHFAKEHIKMFCSIALFENKYLFTGKTRWSTRIVTAHVAVVGSKGIRYRGEAKSSL